MDMYINAVKTDFTLENEKFVGDILKAFETDCEKNNATIIRISIDGENIPSEKLDDIFEHPIDGIKKLEIETVSENDVLNALSTVSDKVDYIIAELLQLPILLQSSKDARVAEIVTLFADEFNILCRLMALCSLFPQRFKNFTIEGQSVSIFLKDFTPILQEFENSLLSHDTVLTGDLAEYEIVPRLEAFSVAVKNLEALT